MSRAWVPALVIECSLFVAWTRESIVDHGVAGRYRFAAPSAPSGKRIRSFYGLVIGPASDNYAMADAPLREHVQSPTAQGNHFSCSMSAVLIARVHAFGGDEAVAELLRSAGIQRSAEYLTDITNWISYDEAVALWEAGGRVTHHPDFARVVGEDAARRLNGSPGAALLRSLGSAEAAYRQIATTATKFASTSTLEFVDGGRGFAAIG